MHVQSHGEITGTDLLHRKYVPNPMLSKVKIKPEDSFSVVCYNILAEFHRVQWDYSYTKEEFLCQEYRHNLLMKEIQYLDSDIVCLQEVNPEYFSDTLLAAMESLGYAGFMKCRIKKTFNEGGAIFYKTDMFLLDSSKWVSLTESAYNEVQKKDLDPDVKAAVMDYLDRADVVLIAHLRFKKSGRVVIIGNVHAWWDDDIHADVKTVQTACAIKEVVRESGSGKPIVICGDLNSDCYSPVYQVAVDGHLSDQSVQTLQHVQNLKVRNAYSKSLVDHLQSTMSHPATTLKSSYYCVLGAEPEITCLTDTPFMLDYIFYDSEQLFPTGVLDMVDKDTIIATGGLPSENFPSDHLSLKTVFSFIQ